MHSNVVFLFMLAVLIWGSTWLAIKFQLGVVDPLASVIYRFALASLLLFIWCKLRGVRLQVSARDHGFIAFQGATLFGISYWLVYIAELYLTSGVVAVIFTTTVFLNIFNARVFLKHPVSGFGLAGGVLGIVGVGLLFAPEIGQLSWEDEAMTGFAYGLGATVLSSLGSMAATRNTHAGIPVMAVNAWGMLYGAGLLSLVALFTGASFRFEWTPSYIGSLLFLTVFGTVIAFGAYLRLLVLIGPGKAGYTTLLIPVVALAISTVFENYQWSMLAAAGLALIVAGNWLALRR